jgi:hypothetical protein
MKKKAAAVLAVMLILSLAACAGAEEKAETQEQTQTQEQAQTETTTPDADWNLPEKIEMPEEVTAVFEKAMDGLTGVGYEPVGYLGGKGGVYCVLCRATVIYPDAKPYYALVYVSDEGLQNIWDIWMGAHAEKK